MVRALARIVRLYENYRYYRHLGAHMHEAWNLAKMTLP